MIRTDADIALASRAYQTVIVLLCERSATICIVLVQK